MRLHHRSGEGLPFSVGERIRKELRGVILARGRLFKRLRVLSNDYIMNRFDRGLILIDFDQILKKFERKTLKIAVKTRFFLTFKRVNN
jgi:hypothetical protein